MSIGQVTITLGRSGQKVVKRPWPGSDGLGADVPNSSGNKRGVENNYAGDSLISTSKRLRGGRTGGSTGYIEPREGRIAASDLRLKLMRKRLAKRIKQEIEERKKIGMSEKMSRTIQSSEGHGRSSLRTIPSTRQMESLQSSYNSITMNKSRPVYSEGMPRVSGSIASSRCTDEMLRLPLPRTTDASRTDYVARPDLSDFSRSKGPVPMTVVTTSTRTNLNASNPVKKILPPIPSMLRSTYPDEPVTVGVLLQSLGLSKYAILFQAEEVDMAVLRQMGDRDLKELGIPMGPRKKILMALMARSKRPIA